MLGLKLNHVSKRGHWWGLHDTHVMTAHQSWHVQNSIYVEWLESLHREWINSRMAIGTALCPRLFHSMTISWCDHFGCATDVEWLESLHREWINSRMAIGTALCPRLFHSTTISWCDHFGCATGRRPFWVRGWGWDWWVQCMSVMVLYTEQGSRGYFSI